VTDPTPSSNSPFIVGVSGHRDLDPADLPRLRAAVAAFVQSLRRELPDTELRFLTGMADGADLLVAETVRSLGVRIEAVLPMPLERYAADFDGESLARLRALLNQRDVDCIELVDPTDAADPASATTRDAGYAHLMQALLRRSSLLLALWDGETSPLPGGTADTVLRYLDVRADGMGATLPLEFVDAVDGADVPNRLAYWIPAARRGSAAAGREAAACYLTGIGDHTLERRAAMPAAFRARLRELNAYNLEHETLRDQGRLGSADSLLAALPAGVELRGRSRLEDIDAQYGKADSLAVYFQRRSDRLFVLFGLMTLAMGLAYLIYEKLTESRLMLFAYLAVLLASVAIYYVLEGRRWFAKHLAYRALAETMRAKFYLRLAGADHRVDAQEILSLSGTDRFHGFGWLGFVLNGVERVGVRARPSYDPGSPQSRCVEDGWIESQHGYFTRKVAALERSTGRTRILRNTLFVFIIGTILSLFAFGDVLQHVDAGLGIPAKNVVTFLMGFFAVLLGAWELHQNKMATRELLWQYRNQLTHFARARSHLGRIADAERRSEVLADLGKDSMMESYLWTIHRYHREHEPPSTGS
jgi:hypothetical protein